MTTQTIADAILPGVSEDEPRRIWFGELGCVEEQHEGTLAVLVGGRLVGMFDREDPGMRDVLIVAVAEMGVNRQHLARAFRVSDATVERAVTRMKQGGLKAVAATGRRPPPPVRTTKLIQRLQALFEQGHGPRSAHRAVARQASYGTVQGEHKKWQTERAAAANQANPQPREQLDLWLSAANDDALETSEVELALRIPMNLGSPPASSARSRNAGQPSATVW
jgi:transposase